MSDVLKALNLEFAERGIHSDIAYGATGSFLMVSSNDGIRSISVNTLVDGEIAAIEYVQATTRRYATRRELGSIPLCDPVAFEDFVEMVVRKVTAGVRQIVSTPSETKNPWL